MTLRQLQNILNTLNNPTAAIMRQYSTYQYARGVLIALENSLNPNINNPIPNNQVEVMRAILSKIKQEARHYACQWYKRIGSCKNLATILAVTICSAVVATAGFLGTMFAVGLAPGALYFWFLPVVGLVGASVYVSLREGVRALTELRDIFRRVGILERNLNLNVEQPQQPREESESKWESKRGSEVELVSFSNHPPDPPDSERGITLPGALTV